MIPLRVPFRRWHAEYVEQVPAPDPHADCRADLAKAADLYLAAVEDLRQANVRALLAERARDELVTGHPPLVTLAPSDSWEGRARRAEARCALLDDRLARAEGRPTQLVHRAGSR